MLLNFPGITCLTNIVFDWWVVECNITLELLKVLFHSSWALQLLLNSWLYNCDEDFVLFCFCFCFCLFVLFVCLFVCLFCFVFLIGKYISRFLPPATYVAYNVVPLWLLLGRVPLKVIGSECDKSYRANVHIHVVAGCTHLCFQWLLYHRI